MFKRDRETLLRFLVVWARTQITGAKVAWQDLCKTKNEGGLEIRPLKEVNHVYGLKLIWRLLAGDSLWGKWIRTNLLKKKMFLGG